MPWAEGDETALGKLCNVCWIFILLEELLEADPTQPPHSIKESSGKS
jgi:hypothetical protein